MKDLEIQILKQDEAVFDLMGGRPITDYLSNFQEEFEQSLVGKALLKEGYKLTDSDIDDMDVRLVYSKK